MKFPSFLRPVRSLVSDAAATGGLVAGGIGHLIDPNVHAGKWGGAAGGFLSGETADQYRGRLGSNGLAKQIVGDELGGAMLAGGAELGAGVAGLGTEAAMTPAEIAARQAAGFTIPEDAAGVSKAQAAGRIAAKLFGGGGKFATGAKLGAAALGTGLVADVASKSTKKPSAATAGSDESSLPENLQSAMKGIEKYGGKKAAKEAMLAYFTKQLTDAPAPNSLAYQALASNLTAPFVSDLKGLGSQMGGMADNLPADLPGAEGFKAFLPQLGAQYKALADANALSAQLAPYLAQQSTLGANTFASALAGPGTGSTPFGQ